ncbi:slightly ste11-like protein, partial [Cryomyces antarcticus]
KLRHREKYPEYRYQPRRSGGRRRSTSDTYTTTLCDKCGGRSLGPPISSSTSTPHTETAAHPRAVYLPPPTSSEGSTPTTRFGVACSLARWRIGG